MLFYCFFFSTIYNVFCFLSSFFFLVCNKVKQQIVESKKKIDSKSAKNV